MNTITELQIVEKATYLLLLETLYTHRKRMLLVVGLSEQTTGRKT